ncbi:MAG: GvpL/GvpF family gas vesicle protein [Myxococcota bacterium]|nr:GvpL/GvpF family gas vesicle protein [Myxococcota bacterium]
MPCYARASAELRARSGARTARGRRPAGGTALYVYGLIRTPGVDLGHVGIEVDGRPERVYTLAMGSVGAAVSHYGSRERILPIRRNLEAHHRVVRDLMKLDGGVLPMRFGHVVTGEPELVRLVADQREDIEEELADLAGKTEMSLKVFWDVENIYDYFVHRDSTILEMRDRLFGDGSEPNREQKIELGRMFADRLAEDRETHLHQVTEVLEDCVEDIEQDDARTERMVMNLALLAEKARLAELDRRVGEAAGRFSGLYVFKYAGPFAPYHFVGLDLDVPARTSASGR